MHTVATDKDQRTWGMLAHFSPLAGFVVPLGGLIAALVLWQIKKDQAPFVAEQARESLNFQLTVLIAVLACIPLLFVVVGMLLIPALGIAQFVLALIAGLRANEGQPYRYPLTLRMVR